MSIDWTKYIEQVPNVAMGKPIFKGTRLTVDFILERLSQGAAAQELIEDYAGLTDEHIAAALAYAVAAVRNEDLIHQS
jgi:uncharacterized protein (DUF433 family)